MLSTCQGLPVGYDVADFIKDGHSLPELHFVQIDIDSKEGSDSASYKTETTASEGGKETTGTPNPKATADDILLRTHEDRLRDRLNPAPMIIDSLLAEGAIGAFIAMPGVGKTLMAIATGEAVAAGTPFAGHAVTPGLVVYVCPDSPASTERRMLAMTPEVAARIFTITDPPQLPGGMSRLREAIERAGELSGERVRLVILDTWDSIREHSSDGYAGQDAMAETMMRGLRKLATELRLAIIIVHHATRQDGLRARGTVVFDARCDWIAVIEAAGTGLQLTSIKARDGERGPVGSWLIQAVEVGDRPVPVLVPSTLTEALSKGQGGGMRDAKILAAVRDLQAEGKPVTISALMAGVGTRSKSTITGPVERLREKGLMAESPSYSPTEAGIYWLNAKGLGGADDE